MKYRESEEMYLETIYMLSKSKGTVRSIDVAEYMNYSKQVKYQNITTYFFNKHTILC